MSVYVRMKRSPSDRVWGVLLRVSFNRFLHPNEIIEIAKRVCKKATTSVHGYNSAFRKWENYRFCIWNGRVIHDFGITPWNKLESDARKNRRQFCLISEHRWLEADRIYRAEMKIRETRSLIRELTGEYRNVQRLSADNRPA